MTQSRYATARAASRRLTLAIAFVAGIGSAGCDKVESLVDDAKKDMGVAPPAQVAETPASPTAPATPVAPVQPIGPTPEALLADLNGRTSLLIDDAILTAVANVPDVAQQVTSLNLTSNQAVTNVGLNAVGKFTNLKRLQISGLIKIESKEFGFLAGLKSLTELEGNSTKIGDDALPLIASLPELRKLSLAQTQLQGAAVSQLQALKLLEELILDNTGTDDGGLRALGALPLRSLSVKRARITGVGVAALGDHPTLEILDVSENTIAGAALAKAKFPALRVLSANNTQFGNDGVAIARRFPNLEELRIRNSGAIFDDTKRWDLRTDFKPYPKLRILDVGKNQLSDIGLSKLIVGARHLEELYLTELPSITDRGLEEILKCKGLKLLDLSYTNVTLARIELLKKKMPELIIVMGAHKY